MKKIKHASSDFTYNDLPKTRKELFFDRILHRYNVLFKLGLLMLLFTIPLLLSIVLKDTIKLSLVSDDGYIDNDSNYSINIIFSFVDIITFAILSIGLAGSFRIIRLYIWDEIIFLKEDFIKGIKNNAKSFIGFSILVSLINILVNLSINIDAPNFTRYLPFGIFIVLILPIVFISLSFNNVYNVTFFQSIKNSTYLFIKQLFIILPFYLLVCLNGLIYFIPYLLFKYLVIFLFTIFLTPIIIFIWNLCMFYVFDKYINIDQYKNIYKKGLYIGDEK